METCAWCKDGEFADLVKLACVTECPAGYYGDRNTAICMECKDNCAECTTDEDCTECKDGFYEESS